MKRVNRLISIFLLAIFCLSCGGGGGGGSANPSITYMGKTDQAVIDQKNAVDLAFGAFIGGEFGSDFDIFNSVVADYPEADRVIKLYDVSKIFMEQLYGIDIYNHIGKSRAVIKEQDSIPGECGGSLSYTLEVDDVTGVFSGSMTFNNYCDVNTTLSGNAEFSGQLDINSGDFLNFQLSINMVTLKSGNRNYTMDGDISFDMSDTSFTASLDMLMKDNNSGQVYWANNYKLNTSEDVDFLDISLTGRFYHPAHGYVDLSTINMFRTCNSYEWPSSGQLQIVGKEDTKASLVVGSEYFFQVIADTNGDGEYNYSSGQIGWSGGSWTDAQVPEELVILPKFTIASDVTAANSDPLNPGKPALGFDGTNYMVVSCRESGSPAGLFGIIVSKRGSISKTFHLADINPVFGCQGQRPSVAFDGTNYLVAFSRLTETGSHNILGIRVTPSGFVLDGPDGFVILSDVSDEPVVAYDGNNFLVVSDKFSNITLQDIYGARVNSDGQVIEEFPIFIAPGGQVFPSVAFDGVNYLVIWSDTRSGSPVGPDADIIGTRVTPAGIVLDPEGISISTAIGIQEWPNLSFDGTNYFAVWQDTRNNPDAFPIRSDIFGTRIKTDGTLLDGPPDTGGVVINSNSVSKQHPIVCYDGLNNFVIWEVSSSYNSPVGIFAARVSPSGVLVDGSFDSIGIPISTDTCSLSELVFPNMISNGNKLFFAFLNNSALYGSAKDIEGKILILY